MTVENVENTEKTTLIKKEKSVGKYVYSHTMVLKQFGPFALGAAVGFPANLSFKDFSYNFWVPLLKHAGAEIFSILSLIPTATLSSESVGNVLTSLAEAIYKTPKNFLLHLASLGLVRPDLWQRQMDSNHKWLAVQTAVFLVGIVKGIAIPASIVASVGLNFSRTGATRGWTSAGPNIFASGIMNTKFLTNVMDLGLNSFTAYLGDKNPYYRKGLLRILEGIKKELPNYAIKEPHDFTKWCDKFIKKENTRAQIIALIQLQEEIGFRNKKNYQLHWSITGLIMLIPALIFTLPLFSAGQKAKSTFNDDESNMLAKIMHWATQTFPGGIFAAGSMICNFAINGLKGYKFGAIAGDWFSAARNKRRLLSQLSLLRGIEFLLIWLSIFFSVFASGAQMSAAHDNPLASFLIVPEMFAVFTASFALYVHTIAEKFQQFLRLYDRFTFRGLNSFTHGYEQCRTEDARFEFIEKLSNIMVEHINKLQPVISAAAYKKKDQSTEIKIKDLVSVISDTTSTSINNLLIANPNSYSSDDTEHTTWFSPNL